MSDPLLLLQVVEGAGAEGIGLRAAGEKLEWAQVGRLERCRDTLRQAGAITVAPGGRGKLIAVLGAPRPAADSLDVASERGLYEYLQRTLVDVLQEGDPASAGDDVPASNVAVEITADLGRAQTGGPNSRPDLYAVVRRNLKAFSALEFHAFEVKPYWELGRLGVMHAFAQRGLGISTHSWVVLYLPGEEVHLGAQQRSAVAEARDALPLLRRETGELGLGLLEMTSLAGRISILNVASRYAADPKRVEGHIRVAAPSLLEKVGIAPSSATM
jgi:hypothetical protein